MNKSSKYTGVIVFAIALLLTILIMFFAVIKPMHEKAVKLDNQNSKMESTLKDNRKKRDNIETNKRNIKVAMAEIQKKVYAPTDPDLEKETLFFTLYSDLMEMIHANGIKIKSISYDYNPESDPFVKDGGKENYFVCDINMEVISNYVNMGKFVQDAYQYPYYMRINEIDIKPYQKDKKILISNISLRLYAHTKPQEDLANDETETLSGASTALPQ